MSRRVGFDHRSNLEVFGRLRVQGMPSLPPQTELMSATALRAANLSAPLLAYSRKQRLDPCTVQLNKTVERMRDLLVASVAEQ
jgi:hypothetical protein